MAADAHVHVVVDVVDKDVGHSMAAIAQAGRGLDWLHEEPDIYSDADLEHGGT